MKVLVVYAHPSHEGHCATILREVENNLKNNNINYRLLDLYSIGYDPLLKEKELYGKDVELTDDTKAYQQQISESDLLIFIYPVWWNSMPAILKGFFDRTFTSRFAFRYKPMIPNQAAPFFERIYKIICVRFDYGIPIGLLDKKKAIVFLTTGSPKYISYPWNGNRFIKIIKKDTLGFFGIKSKVYHISNCRKFNEYKVEEIRRTVKNALKKLKPDHT